MLCRLVVDKCDGCWQSAVSTSYLCIAINIFFREDDDAGVLFFFRFSTTSGNCPPPEVQYPQIINQRDELVRITAMYEGGRRGLKELSGSITGLH